MESPDVLLPDIDDLHIGNSTKSFSVGDDTRLKVGIDFGTTSSSVCYDIAGSYTPLEKCRRARSILKDNNGDHRFPTVASVVRKFDAANGEFCEFIFGKNNLEPDHFVKFEVLAKFELIKLGLVPQQHPIIQDNGTNNMLDDLRMRHQDAIQALAPVKDQIHIRDPLSGTHRVHPINTIDDIIEAFLHVLLQAIKLDCRTRYNLSVATANKAFQDYTDIAISVPTVWDGYIMDHVRFLLHRAGYPKSTFLVSEPRSAALFHFAEHLNQSPGMSLRNFDRQVLFVVDIGGGTTDVTCLGSTVEEGDSDDPDPTITIGELTRGAGSLHGSLQLSELFKTVMRKEVGEWGLTLSNIAGGFQVCEHNVAEALAAGFEMTKRNFANDKAQYFVLPRPSMGNLRTIHTPAFRTSGSRIILTPPTMQTIFDEWLRDIVAVVQPVIDRLRHECSEFRLQRIEQDHLKIGLTGWGSLPPYVHTKLRAHFLEQGIMVQQMEIQEDSPVAQGNYLTLVSQDCFLTQRASVSYGIRDDPSTVVYDFLGRKARAIIEQGTDLRSLSGEYTATKSFLRINDPQFPLRVSQEIITSRRTTLDGRVVDGEIQSGDVRIAGEFVFDPVSQERSGFQVTVGEDGSSFLDLEFSVGYRLQGMLAWLVCTVPHGGRFDGDRDSSLDMRAEFLVTDLYNHCVWECGTDGFFAWDF